MLSASIEMSKRCRICAETLSKDAKKCVNCGEFQSWYRRLLFGVGLRDLVTLVPVVALAFAFVQDRLETKHSNARLSIVACEQGAITLFASNTGNRAAVIGGATYSVGSNIPRRLLHRLEPSSRLLNGGEARSVEFSVSPSISPGGLVPHEERNDKDCTVSITVETTTFDHRRDPKTVTCACPPFSS